jgi:hypothetical protein
MDGVRMAKAGCLVLERESQRKNKNLFLEKENGGGDGIRTHETVTRLHAFQAGSFNHSDTPPQNKK